MDLYLRRISITFVKETESIEVVWEIIVYFEKFLKS